MAPGLFCFIISGTTIVPITAASITSPGNSQLFSSRTISAVQLEVQGLSSSASYSIFVNNQPYLVQGSQYVISTAQGTISATLDLTAQPDGGIVIRVVKTSDSTTLQVSIIKDTLAPGGVIVSPLSGTRVDTPTIFVYGTAVVEPAGVTVSLTISDTDDVTPDIQASSIRVDPAGNWGVNVNLESLAGGDITITATFTDAAGNTGLSRVRIIKALPSIFSILTPSSGSYINLMAVSSVRVSGLGEAGSVSVTATDSRNTLTSTTTVGADQTWALPTTMDLRSFAEGPINFMATLTDSVTGNQLSTATAQVIKDTVVAVAITAPIGGSYINLMTAATFSITGTGDARGLVTVTVTDSLEASLTLREITVLADQSWSTIADLWVLQEGTITIVASIIDPAGNRASSTPVQLTKDTRASAAITSPINGEYVNYLNVVAFPISGTGDAGGQISIVVTGPGNRQVTATATVPQNQQWSFSPNLQGIPDGELYITASIIDVAGNRAVAPGQVQVYKDTVLPSGAIISPSIGFVQNSINFVYGYAEVGAAVSLTIADSDANTRNIVITPISVTAAGDWTVRNIDISSLVDGSITLFESITDAAGNTNLYTVSTLIKDTVVAISITSPISGSYVNFMTASGLGVSGRGDALGFVTVVATDSQRNRITSTTTVAEDQTWSLPTNMNLANFVEGTVSLVASIVDPAGNEASSTTIVLTKDTMISGLIISPLTGYIGSTVNVYGTADIGASVSLNIADTDEGTRDIVISTISVNEAGNWAAENIDISTQTEGSTIVITATIADAAGNTVTSIVRVIKDSVAAVSIASPTSGSSINSIIVSSVEVTGRGDALGTVTVTATDSQRNTLTATATVSENQSWRLTWNLGNLAEGTVTLVASIVDPAGNQASSTPVQLTKDTIAAVSVTSPISGSYINSQSASAFQITGMGDIGGLVTLTFTDRLRNQLTTVATVSQSQTWTASINLARMEEGPISLVASIADPVGNQAFSMPVQLTKDTTISGTISLPAAGSFIRSTVSVSGTAEVGATVSLTIADIDEATRNVVVSSIRVNSAGNWVTESTDISTQAEGSITITAVIADAAGNTVTSIVRVIKDSVAAVSITSPSSGSYINSITASSVEVTGRGDALGTVTVTATDSRGNTIIGTATVGENQSWRLPINLNLASMAEGTVTLAAGITDPAGNQASSSLRVIKDTITFAAITSPAEFTFINQYNVNNLRIRGTGEAGGSVVVKIEDSSSSTPVIQTAAIQVSEQGTWEIAAVDVSSQAEGSIRVSATIADVAGNRFTSNPITLTKDTIVTIVIASPTNLQYVISAARGTISIAGYGDAGTNVFVTVSDSDSNTQNVVSSTVLVSPVGTWSMVVNISTL